MVQDLPDSASAEPALSKDKTRPVVRKSNEAAKMAAPTQRKAPLLLTAAALGFIAGGVGFGVAYFVLSPQTTPLVTEGQIADLQNQIDGLTLTIAALPDTGSSLAAFDSRLEGVTRESAETAADMSARLDALGLQLAALKAQPANKATLSLESQAALDQATSAALAQIAAALPSADAILAQNLDLGRLAAARLALAELQLALNAGRTFSDPLAQIAALGFDTRDLDPFGEQGVRSLDELSALLDEQARPALKAALAPRVDQTPVEKLMGFLRVQSGARALTPQQGMDPDAILSRAVQALRQGRVALAVSEIATLPVKAQTILLSWSGLADAYLAATAAFANLATEMAQR